MRTLLTLLTLLTLHTAFLKAEEIQGKLWSGLVHATTEQRPSDTTKTFDLQARLAKSFPDYQHFSLLGEHQQDIDRDYETWIVPSETLFLNIDYQGQDPESGGKNLNLQLWQNKRIILKTDVQLQPNQPLFIAGPSWKEGRLILILNLPE